MKKNKKKQQHLIVFFCECIEKTTKNMEKKRTQLFNEND